MTVHYADDWLTVRHGDVRTELAELADESVHCVVTSPPYWGLRDYGTATWTGGDPECDHTDPKARGPQERRASTLGGGVATVAAQDAGMRAKPSCGRCGAQRQDNQLGLEPTPEQYVENMVAVFREVRRVLRSDGTLWLNLGDSYAGGGGYAPDAPSNQKRTAGDAGAWGKLHSSKLATRSAKKGTGTVAGLKPKDLVGIPWRVAFALQQPYYTGRIKAERDRVWMAAMIDAEGTICGFRHERPNANVRTGMLVFITNSDTRVLDEADRIWPGARYIDHNRVGDDMGHGIIANRDSWRWQIQKADERSAFVRELYPYLISKRQQAAVAWNLLEFTKAALRMGRGGETPEVKAKRDVLVGLLSDLNHYRPVVIPDWVREPPAMTEPGWYLRSDVIWAKSNPMPESVTDRPTKSHEYLFLLAKSARYYFDADAVREALSESTVRIHGSDGVAARAGEWKTEHVGNGHSGLYNGPDRLARMAAGRNLRSVWTVATQPYPGAHFATFPPKLIEPCIKAGTSERGVCPECGAPWGRVVELGRVTSTGGSDSGRRTAANTSVNLGRGNANTGAFVAREHVPTGWQPSCAHVSPLPPQSAVVLDPFAGSGTTGMVAQSLSRRAVLIDLNIDYLGQLMDRNKAIPLGLGEAS